jgi:hypothetical protein
VPVVRDMPLKILVEFAFCVSTSCNHHQKDGSNVLERRGGVLKPR